MADKDDKDNKKESAKTAGKKNKDAQKRSKPTSDNARVATAVAVTATVFSPRVRGMLRRGAVYGLAGVLTAGDMVTAFARGIARGMQETDDVDGADGGEEQNGAGGELQ
jgi:hypothetical protein